MHAPLIKECILSESYRHAVLGSCADLEFDIRRSQSSCEFIVPIILFDTSIIIIIMGYPYQLTKL